MHISARLAPALLLAALSTPAAAEDPASIENIQVVQDATYSADSAEARQIRQWLQKHAVSENGSPIGRTHQDGGFRVVSRRKHDVDPANRSFDPPPPAPLRNHGVPGEVIELTHTSPGVSSQKWTYEWVGNPSDGSWLQVYYHYTKTGLSASEAGP